ncbi:MAG: hypothetical protein K6T81_19015 [Alicyclobacillus macrosporangiidus]|uniref:hypothetical protein n=1 Tax=Alicyclobacillus macrosporangiidus TaxID=392015 RepID=UPI0026ED3135|nr:hypothetical protein [Alicyclobacillus macrosporangiidus]MCL6600803.1 hypothetical protein [Alicyclobacillus macrosporangiidus]
MLVALWLLAGLALILTVLAAFAIPSWPVLAVFLLALVATVGRRVSRAQAILVIALAIALLVVAYDVVELILAIMASR